MSVVATFPGKLGDALHQWPVMYHWAKKTGQQFECWMDEVTCGPLVSLFEAQPCVSLVKLIGGVENHTRGGQPFHMNLLTSSFDGNTVYHLGLRGAPQRQLTLEAMLSSKVPVYVKPEVLANEVNLVIPDPEPVKNRLIIHGQGQYCHSGTAPTVWKFIHGIKAELEGMFDEIAFVGSSRDLEVSARTYPQWKVLEDGGNLLNTARFIAGSRAMIGCGSAPIVMAGLLGIPAIRVHDALPGDPPRVYWSNLGENQLNDTEIGLRKSWPKFRDKWLMDSEALKA